jgi:hypothetical protein
MKRLSINRFYLIVFCCTLIMVTSCSSSSQDDGDTELLSVVAISRHGIRSQTSSMNLFTLRPQGFPVWPYPEDTAGNLSTWGQENATRLGSWHRDFYSAQGLLPERGSCPEAGTVYVYADVFERTKQTAQGYVDGMLLSEETTDCGIQVVQWSLPGNDPYITTAAAGVCGIDTTADQVAFYAKIGNIDSLISTYSAQLDTLQAVTQCCEPSACDPPAGPCRLLDLSTEVTTTGSVGFKSGSLFDAADNLTETFELEYAQGMPDTDCETTPGSSCVGWGAIPAGGLSDMTKLHVRHDSHAVNASPAPSPDDPGMRRPS